MPSRRTFLAASLTFVGAGCASVPDGWFNGADDRCLYEAEAKPFDPAGDVPRKYDRLRSAFARRTIRQGRAATVYGPRPFRNVAYVEYEGAYYRLEFETSRTTTVPALVLSVVWEQDRSPPTDQSVVQITSLPRDDRLAIRSAVYGGLYRPQVHPETTVYVSESPIPYPDGPDESDLPTRESVWVRWDGRVYEVTAHTGSTMEILAHEYSASRVAGDADAFREYIDAKYVTQLENLTADERVIIETAIDGVYEERTRTPSSAVDRLYDRLRDVEFPQSYWTYYVEYDGQRYRLWLHQIERCAH